MIIEATGNLLRADTEALVNTVNTVGVMGKGIALQFRRAYPEMFQAYKEACEHGEVRIGRMHVWRTGMLDGPRYIINFPTKRHWRASSKLPDIEAGLVDLVNVITELRIKSIAVPPLGCGNGGLDWAEVEPVIVSALRPLPNLDVRLYLPGNTPAAAEMLNATPRPEMTVGRAALIELLSRYLRNSLEATPLEIQKLMYFLQVVGEPLRLEFSKGRYGPYADGLRRVLSLVEGHFLTGYGDGSSRVLEATSIRPLPAAGVEASRVLDCHPATRQRIAVVDNLTDGFESMYGMELLSTVHWLAVHDRCAALDWRRNAELVREWTPRKAEIFTDDHVHEAWLRLRAYDLIEGNALNRPSRRMSERMPSGGKVVTVRVSRAELGARLIQAIRESAFPISDVAVITATRGESNYIQQLLDAEEIPTRSLEEFDGTWLDAVKVGTVRRAKGLEFAAVFHPTPAHGPVDQLSSEERSAAELIQRQALVAMTRARDYLWIAVVEE
ncbi:type II toxin-antitoxin system antitoxin DNA ADP-ribosyl glycohydrolase DarG [Nocardia wallacei]|uniref:type II toxin-antitoxin system antitoxin DNA ADP-ribosyl glycohydrolase DarG n=1 Tax=Nocardia wallacei TaxID=480035 RepID=UPI0024577C2B|nr:macro domain-containing protein [Nocardia wallacei]